MLVISGKYGGIKLISTEQVLGLQNGNIKKASKHI